MRARHGGRITTVLVCAATALAAAGGAARAAGPCAGTSCTTEQQVGVSIAPGSLVHAVRTAGSNPDATTIRLAPGDRGHGHGHSSGHGPMRGVLNTVTVTDTRGFAQGWSLSASITDLTDGRRTVDNRALRVTPSCRATAAGSAPGITPGPAGQRADEAVMLCAKDTTVGPAGSSGGIYDVGADLVLNAPPASSPYGYAAIVTLQLA